jgi:hypothetical protein
MNYIKRFLGFFILEFAIIFVVAYGANILVHGSMPVISMVIFAVVGSAVIASTSVSSWGNKVCWWKKDGAAKTDVKTEK